MASARVEGVRTGAAVEAFHDALLADDVTALYERAPCGYLSTTPHGLIVKVNETFLTWTGYRREDLVGRRRFVDLLTGGGKIYHETHYITTLQMHGTVREIALDIVTADGARLPALVNSVLDDDGTGRPVVIRTAVFDATERRSYERELVAAKERAEAAEARARETALALQQVLLPPAPPEIPGLDVGVAFHPAGSGDELGGDFYDVFEIAPDDWLVVVGDVCGKGIEAAGVSALARHTIRAMAVRTPRSSQILATLNDVLLRDRAQRYLTAVLVRLRPLDGRWSATVCAAGHPLGILVSPDREPTDVGEHGGVVGLLPSPHLTEVPYELGPGDAIVLFTDGITEARRADGEFFGSDRLRDAVQRHLGAATVHAAGILQDALTFQHGYPRDDCAVVVVRVPAGPGP